MHLTVPLPAIVVMMPARRDGPDAAIELIGDVQRAVRAKGNPRRIVQLGARGRTAVAGEPNGAVAGHGHEGSVG